LDTDARRKLLDQVKRGRKGWSKLWFIVILLATCGTLIEGVSTFSKGKGSFSYVGSLLVGVFIFAIAVMAFLIQQMNDRFSALVELLGEDDELRHSE
jgi:hypothetical protein